MKKCCSLSVTLRDQYSLISIYQMEHFFSLFFPSESGTFTFGKTAPLTLLLTVFRFSGKNPVEQQF